jgi:4,5-DOPA dioxygenase extradiol
MTAPLRHPFLDHLDRAADLEAAQPQPLWTPLDGALPSLYISHGAPPVFEDSAWMQQLHRWARALPKPRAILIVSAH